MNESMGVKLHELRRARSLAHANPGFSCKVNTKILYGIWKSEITFTVTNKQRLCMELDNGDVFIFFL